MPTTASQFFDHLERRAEGTIERHEIASESFGSLRRSLRKLVLALHEPDEPDALELSDHLRALLSEWLTVPIPFDRALLDAIREALGEPHAVQARWGVDIRALYEASLRSAEALLLVESPVREELRSVVQHLLCTGQSFRIYCHKRAREHFESLLNPGTVLPGETVFLHTLREYRDSAPFHTLVKVGPLRSRGWGSAPDALLTAPLFHELVQVVWSGCSDEPDFGYDPAAFGASTGASPGSRPSGNGAVRWTKRITRSGDLGEFGQYAPEEDELQVFRDISQSQERRRARLLQVDGDSGILYPLRARVLSLDASAKGKEAIDRRVPGETLTPGMFVILPALDEVDLGGVQAEHGHCSRIWKQRLGEEIQRDKEDLIRRLRVAGLGLASIGGAVLHWAKAPGTVIHAPKQIAHFRILIDVLGASDSADSNPRTRQIPFWKRAWNEVRRSRGEAIQAGLEEHEIVEEELALILKEMIPDILKSAATAESFSLPIPAGKEIQGDILFLRIDAIEDGFTVPDTELRTILEFTAADRWRD